jgi:hypothetical protein
VLWCVGVDFGLNCRCEFYRACDNVVPGQRVRRNLLGDRRIMLQLGCGHCSALRNWMLHAQPRSRRDREEERIVEKECRKK